MKIPALRPEMAALLRGNLVYGSKLKCTIKFTPIRGVGDAAPYCGTGCSIKIYNVQQGKVHGTMQASSRTHANKKARGLEIPLPSLFVVRCLA